MRGFDCLVLGLVLALLRVVALSLDPEDVRCLDLEVLCFMEELRIERVSRLLLGLGVVPWCGLELLLMLGTLSNE